MSVYTLATWTVRPGREDEFVRLWAELGRRTIETFPSASGTLIRDRTTPNRFISFGPWADEEEVAEWRALPAFTETIAAMREVLEDFGPGTYDEVLRMEGGA